MSIPIFISRFLRFGRSSWELIIDVDKSCSLAICKAHEWVLVPPSLAKFQDAEHTRVATERILKRHQVELSVAKAEFEAHQQAGEARWEQGDAVAKGRIPAPVLEQMRTRASTSLSIPQSSLPPGVCFCPIP